MSQTPQCPSHGEMKWKPDGVSKAGKPYSGFWTCGKKNPDGSWCDYKPVKGTPAATNTQKFSASLDASANNARQDAKDILITRTAIAKSLIEANMAFNMDTVKEATKWVNWCLGKSVNIEPKEPEIDVDVAF